MTGGSLGLRTGSYGSLQSQFQNGAAFPIQSTLVFARKPAKMLPTGSREKEKIILPWVCKLYGKRKAWMLLILIASVAVFSSFISVINKENNDKEHVSIFTRWDNESHPSVIVPYYRTLPVLHPCENFSIPHLQIDRKRTGPRPCPVCYVPVEQAIIYMPALPSKTTILKNLTYVIKENSFFNESDSGSFFGGHPSLKQRNDYFDIKDSMTVHCGFVGGKKPGQGTGFDIDDDDLLEMDRCQGVVVASAIFGKYDVMQQPKNISEVSKTTVCFFMFLDEETAAYIKNSSSMGSTKKVGLWRIVVVRNLPYEDARRNGKVPKLLLHRLFPNARFSLWVDGKLELVVDPYQVLERFLWRKNASFAISRHYRRFDVFEEAEANKAAGKYDNASIDYQIEFYKKEGLTHYSELKLPITSDVPEGCVIIREHIPITNLFTCIWFNEVDRFTSRDQLSFSTVRDKIMQRVNWTIDMFLDCERRNFVIQAYHRDLLEQRNAFATLSRPPPSNPSKEPPPRSNKQILPNRVVGFPMKKLPPTAKHRKSGSRRHRPRPPAIVVSSKDIN